MTASSERFITYDGVVYLDTPEHVAMGLCSGKYHLMDARPMRLRSGEWGAFIRPVGIPRREARSLPGIGSEIRVTMKARGGRSWEQDVRVIATTAKRGGGAICEQI